MSRIPGIRRLFKLPLSKRTVGREVEDELAFHLETRVGALRAQGLTEQEARARAHAEFGDVAAARSELEAIDRRRIRKAHWSDAMETFAKTLRHAYRTLRGSPATSLTVVFTLALGIGVTTVVFSIVYGVLLRPLPYPESDRLVRIWLNNPRQGIERDVTSYPNFLDWREQSRSFEAMVAVDGAALNLEGVGEPRELFGSNVSEGYFRMLEVAPALGRAFTAEEGRAGGPNVVILSHELWATQFGADAGVVGRTLDMSGEPYEVVGVMPPQMGDDDFWIPLRPSERLREARGSLWLPVLGRLAPGVSLEEAQSEMSGIARRLVVAYPEVNEGMGVLLEPLRNSIVGDARQPLLVLLGAVAFVLLIACANVANVLLARGTARRTEMAVRAALGASRRRLAGQVLAESLLLALAGGVLGILIARWGVQGLVALAPPSLPRLDEVRLDGPVLGFISTVTVLSGLVFGLVPALEACGRPPADAIRRGGRGTVDGSGSERLRPVLVASQFALAMMLLIGAGLMVRSFAEMQRIDPGFDPDNVAVVELAMQKHRYPMPAQVGAFYRELLESVRAMPGVESAAGVTSVLLGRLPSMSAITVEGMALPPALEAVPVTYDAATPGALETLRMRLLRGRGLLPSDEPRSPTVAVINETFARVFFRGEDPLGRRFSFGSVQSEEDWITIVGVVADARRSGLTDPVRPGAFIPHTQFTTRRLAILVRTGADPLAIVPQVRAAVKAIDPNQPIGEARSLGDMFASTVAPRRFLMVLLVLFGGAACVLAAIGIYGVMAYVVGRRTREIGVRMALGARPVEVLRLVIGQAMGQAVIGLGLGLVGALLLGGVIRGQLYNVAPTDPLTLAATAAVLVLVALVASYLPARRAARTDPQAVLRAE